MHLVRVAGAEAARQRGKPVVQRPDLGARGHQGRGQQREVDAAATLAVQLLGFDELHDLIPCRLMCMAQQADIVERACPRRGRGPARKFNEYEWMGKRLIGRDQMNEWLVASAEMVDPHRSIDQYVHCSSAPGRRRGTSAIPGTVPPSAARRLAA